MGDDPEARKTQTSEFFDHLVEDYDVIGPGCFAHFGKRLVETVGIEPGMHVLDVASGRGAVMFPAAERVGPKGAVTGIELSDGMARATNEDAKRRGIDARVRVMDAEQLDFPEGTFDRVLCGFGLMFFPDLGQALGEFRRVLKPEGRIGVSTWRVSQEDDLRLVLDELGLGGPGEVGWITDPNDLADRLARAGFSDVSVIADSEVFRYSDLDQYWRNARGTALRRRLDTLDAEQTERVRAALAERVALHTRTDGLYLEATALLAIAIR